MADGTHIEWTEATWNIVTGCSVKSPGCTNCYAMRLAGTRLQHHPSREGLTRATKAGPVWTGEVRFNKEWLDQPLRWRRPRRIFVCAHGDLFHEDVPDEWLDRIFAVMALCPQHVFQVLTKRADRMRDYFWRYDMAHDHNCADFVADAAAAMTGRGGATGADRYVGHGPGWPLPNVWLGVSVEDQVRAQERIPDLLATPAAIRWLSMEPLLGPVDLNALSEDCCGLNALSGLRENPYGAIVTRHYGTKIDWIVLGGESGPGARPMQTEWARTIRDECSANGVPFFFKQWGAWWPLDQAAIEWGLTMAEAKDYFLRETTETHALIGKGKAGRKLDRVEHDGMPA